MALTMTRTRTQTTLTKLAVLVANVHGELGTLDSLACDWPDYQQAISARRRKLEAERDALYLTLKQFDPKLDGTRIRALNDWMRPYGRRGSKTALRRYLGFLGGCTSQ